MYATPKNWCACTTQGINPENEETIKTHVESAKIKTALEHITKALSALGKLPTAD
jgi:hypothetical protein